MVLHRLSSTTKVDHPSNKADMVADSKLVMAAVPHHLGPRQLEMSELTRN